MQSDLINKWANADAKAIADGFEFYCKRTFGYLPKVLFISDKIRFVMKKDIKYSKINIQVFYYS